MIWFGVISILPDIVRAGAGWGVFGRAINQGVVQLDLFDPRRHTSDRHQTVDDRPYGGGPGMVMMVQPMLAAISEARETAARLQISAPVIHLSPQGERLDQKLVKELAELPGMILACGRYEGLDQCPKLLCQIESRRLAGD